MSRQIPSYLRLHASEEVSSSLRRPKFQDLTHSFWHAFAEATGWVVARQRENAPLTLRSGVGMGAMMSVDEYHDSPLVDHDSALALAHAATALTEQLAKAEECIRNQEVRLAAADVVPLSPDPAIRQPGKENLADRVRSVLEDALVATGSQAAGLYMLDDDTSHLKLRAVAGLPTQKLMEPHRPLRGSAVDLEALVGNVVTISDFTKQTHWSTPEPFAAAICVAISVGDTPVGTMWLWSDRAREFGDAEIAALKLTARVVAAELTEDTLKRRVTNATKHVRPLKMAAAWQQRQQPLDTSLALGWHVAGWSDPAQLLSSHWYCWDVLPDGTLAIVLAEALGGGFETAMIAATARAAWQSHAGYRHAPGQLLARLSDTLWQTNTGDQLLAMFYAQLNPETGEGTFATAGDLGGMITSQYGFRPLFEPTQSIGTQIDFRPRENPIRLAQGETLSVFTSSLVERACGERECLTENGEKHLSQQRFAEIVRGAGDVGPKEQLAALRRAMAAARPMKRDRAVVSLKREQ